MNAPLPAHLLPRLEPRPVPAAMLDALRAQFGTRCSTALAVREQHGRDESPIDAPPPEAVVYCESTDDVAAVVRLADHYAVPVIPFGVGSGLVSVFVFAFYTHGPAVRARYAASEELQTNVDGGGASRPAGSISRGCKLAHETCRARR